MGTKLATAGVVLYVLVAAVAFWLLGQISGSADMPLWKELLWAATWPLIPIWLLLN